MIYFIPILLLIVIVYNIMVKKYNKVKEGYSTLDVYLKKRYDLIPNLVNCVKEYSSYEAKVLNDVLMIRGNNYDKELVNNIIVGFENYPFLKADDVFINLQKNLNNIEEQISAARRNYNACVNDYNNFISFFPINLIALLFRYKKCDLYGISDIEKKAVDIDE